MAERFLTLNKNTEITVPNGCPIALLGYAVLYDTEQEKKILQVKLQNTGAQTITQCRAIYADPAGTRYAEHIFENLKAGPVRDIISSIVFYITGQTRIPKWSRYLTLRWMSRI